MSRAGASPDEAFRRTSGKVSRQASVFLAGTLSSVVLGYLFKAYLGRTLGAEALGIYALGFQVVGVVVLLAGLGLPQVLARYVTVYRNRGDGGRIARLLGEALRRTAVASCVGAVFLWLVRQPLAQGVFNAPGLADYLPLFALLIPLSAANSLLGQYLRGHQEVTQRTLIQHFVQLPVKIGATLILLGWGLGLTGYIAGELLSQLLAVALLLRLAGRLTPAAAADDPPGGPPSATASTSGRRLLHQVFTGRGLDAESASYGRHMLTLESLRFVSQRVDILLLGALLSADRVGIYSMAVASAAFVPTLLRAVISIFGPIISDLHSRGDMELLQRLFKTTTHWCLGLTLPLVIVLVAFAPALMGLFGEPFVAGSGALVWLVVGQLVNVGTGAVGNLLVMSGHQRLEVWVSAATVVFTLGFGLWCIPTWGMVGAALAASGGLMLANGLRLVLVWRHLGLRPYDVQSLRLVVPLVVAGAGVWWSLGTFGETSLTGLFAGLGLGYALFGLAAWPLASADDRVLWGQLMRRRRANGDGGDALS